MIYTRTFLKKVWTRARRKRVLYSALNGGDRTYFWVTLEVMKINDLDRLCSAEVGTIIVKILAKLKEAMKCAFVKAVETEGYQKAEKMAAQAVEWGYAKAKRWALDHGFSMYLTFLDFTKPKVWVV